MGSSSLLSALMPPHHVYPPRQHCSDRPDCHSYGGRWIYEEKGSAAFSDLPKSFKCPVRGLSVTSGLMLSFHSGLPERISADAACWIHTGRSL